MKTGRRRRRQAHELVEYPLAQRLDDLTADPAEPVGGGELADAANEEQHDDGEGNPAPQRFLPLGQLAGLTTSSSWFTSQANAVSVAAYSAMPMAATTNIRQYGKDSPSRRR